MKVALNTITLSLPIPQVTTIRSRPKQPLLSAVNFVSGLYHVVLLFALLLLGLKNFFWKILINFLDFIPPTSHSQWRIHLSCVNLKFPFSLWLPPPSLVSFG
jgi:hypothetical protein